MTSPSQRGDTLIEVLVAIAIFGLLGVILLGGFAVASKADEVHRASGSNTVELANAAAALTKSTYEACATAADYTGSLGYTAGTGSTISVSNVEYWTLNSNPATFANRACNPALGQAQAAGDTGLQRVTLTVTTTRSGHRVRRTRTVLKRFTGTYAEPAGDPTPGGAVCTISAPSQVDTTWVDEFLGQQNANHAADSHMDILYLAGSRRYSYVRFNIAAGATCEEGGTLPGTADIKAARLRLYTYNIGGLPACGANSCWHALERVRSAWTANSITWNNQPCPTGYGASCAPGGAAGTLFEHGTGALDWSPRFQYIESPLLLSEVRSYLATPSLDYGWVIKEACAVTYSKACGDISPGFQFRSKLASANQRPALELTYV